MKHSNYFSNTPTLWLALILFLPLTILAQVGINNTNPAAGSILDITSSDKGILAPRMNVANLSTIAPVTGGAPDGLIVYNTNTTTGPGLIVWNAAAGQWLNVDGNKDWKKGGNAGTTPGTGLGEDFIGSSDNVSFEVGTNSTSRARFEEDGQISMGFGAAAVNVGQQVNVLGSGTDWDGLGGFSGGIGSGIYGQNIAGGTGVYGLNAGVGPGIYGVNVSTGVAIYGESFSGAPSIYGLDGPIQADQTAFGGDAFVGLADDPTFFGMYLSNADVAGTGLLSFSGPLGVNLTTGSGVASSGSVTGLFAYAGEGDAIVANDGNSAAFFLLDTDSDLTTNDFKASASIAGFADVDPDGSGLSTSQDSYFGGYFSGGLQDGTETFAYVGMRHNTAADGASGTDYKIIGTGIVSTLIEDDQNRKRIMFAPEAPEILFQDYGIGNLVNGVAQINLDPILQNAIHVDAEHPLKVFITLEGECNGIYVTNKSGQGFTVKELGGGMSNVPFSWQIVANRADTKDAAGNVISSHIDQRLPYGPGPLQQKEVIVNKEDRKKYEVNKTPSSAGNNTQYSKEELQQIGTQIDASSAKKRGNN